MNITQEYIKTALDYNPETGIFAWKVRPREHFNTHEGMVATNAARAGKVAGAKDPRGYVKMSFYGRQYYAHRLVFLYMDGEMPHINMDIDHISGDKSDNRAFNLRVVSKSINKKNTPLYINNKSGQVGVDYIARIDKWRVRIRVECKSIHLGYVSDFDDAVKLRKSAEKEHDYTERHGEKRT